MRFPNKELIEMLRKEYPVGCRVKLLEMDDVQAPPIGTLGTVQGVDDAGSIMVRWDNGCGLSVVYGADRCRKLPQCPLCGEYYSAPPAISRANDKSKICPTCGMRQAMQVAGFSEEEQQKVFNLLKK